MLCVKKSCQCCVKNYIRERNRYEESESLNVTISRLEEMISQCRNIEGEDLSVAISRGKMAMSQYRDSRRKRTNSLRILNLSE